MAILDATADVLPNGFARSQLAAALSPRIQELILLPTEKCNFRCTYCYEDFELGKMSEETQVAIERFVMRRLPELTRLRFSWFGGEPLLAKDVVLRLCRFAKQHCDARGIAFDGGFTTNAYLLDSELAATLIQLNQTFFQITLDGFGDTHDVVRRRADGRGTFDVIWKNLKELKKLDLKFQALIRIHVRRDNQENLELLMRELAGQFRGDRRFSLDFQHLRDMGGDGGKTVLNAVTRGEIPSIERRLRGIFANPKGVDDREERVVTDQMPAVSSNAESAGGQRPDERNLAQPYICYAAKANSLLIRSNGRIGKCTVAFDDDRNDIGSLEPDGTIRIDNDKFAPWIRGLGSLSPDEVGCPISQMGRSVARKSGAFRGITVVAA
jgi:uncharacterized protein